MGTLFFKKSIFKKTGLWPTFLQRQDARFMWFKMESVGIKQLHEQKPMMTHFQNPNRFNFTGYLKMAHATGYWWYILHLLFPKRSNVFTIIPIKLLLYLLIALLTLNNFLFLILIPISVIYSTFFNKANKDRTIFTIKYFKSPIKKFFALLLIFLLIFLRSIMRDLGKIRAFIDYSLLKKVNSELR